MKNALFKDTFREIRHSLSRFLSIFAIVALGTGFFAGVKATCPDMKITADKYFHDYNLMDIRLVSTMGFNKNDIDAVKKISGINGVSADYSMDAVTERDKREFVLKVMGLSLDKIKSPDKSYMNRPKLLSGRFPQKADECVVGKSKVSYLNLPLGSKVSLSSGTDKDIGEDLKTKEYTVVGIVEDPYYISFEMGTSTVGDGEVKGYIMIPEENFKMSVYTDMYLTVKGTQNEFYYGDEYGRTIKPVKTALIDTAKIRQNERYNEIIKEAEDKLDEKRKELRDAEDKQKTELASAKAKLDSSSMQIKNGRAELEKKKAEFSSTIQNAEESIFDAQQKLDSGEGQYQKNLSDFNSKKQQAAPQFASAQKSIDDYQKIIDDNEKQIEQLEAYLASGDVPAVQKPFLEAKIQSGRQELKESQDALDAKKNELKEKENELASAEEKLKSARAALDASEAQLGQKRAELEKSKSDAAAQFATAQKKIDISMDELKQGQKDYDNAKEESDNKIADGRQKISDAEDEIKKIKEPEWYVLDRSMTPGLADYKSVAERIDAIAKVFPVFFFLVAALVCLTTMTRMVDENRVNIGTLKALGYSKAKIASKFIAYSAIASISGSIIGILIGFRVFPTVIFNAYGIIYSLPHVITQFNTFYAAVSIIFAVLVTTLSALAACYGELTAVPSVLMLPKAPKAGKRILLEKIKFIWKRFSFTGKITARNLFRYKKRFMMTVLGICGCTALLLAGFGLKDSIVSIVDKQFYEIYKYDMTADLKDEVGKGGTSPFIEAVSKNSDISDYMLVKEQNITAVNKKAEKDAELFVPESRDKMKDFIVMRVRTTGQSVPFGDDGVVLTEKLAKMIHASIGDKIYLKNGEDNKVSVKVSGITENYVSHYVYMSPALYEKVYGNKPKFQYMEAKTTNKSESFQNKLSSSLLKKDGVKAINFTTGLRKTFKDMIKSLDYVVLVLIVSAGGLAFVVLYNLTNINVTERVREIATIKVLGFYDNEVSSYVYRENVILAIIGMLFGLVMGIFLERYIVVTAEIDYAMFGRIIKPMSFVYSGALTMLFSVLVNIVMYFKLKKISMVESLKSVD